MSSTAYAALGVNLRDSLNVEVGTASNPLKAEVQGADGVGVNIDTNADGTADFSINGSQTGFIFDTRQVSTAFTRIMYEGIKDYLSSPSIAIGWINPLYSAEEDLSGNGHTINTFGSPSDAQHVHQGLVWGFDFDNNNDYFLVDDADTFSFGDGSNDSPVSFLSWIYVSDSSLSKIIASKHDTNKREWIVQLQTEEKISFLTYDESAGVSPSRETDEPIAPGWHFVGVTYDGSGGATNQNGTIIYIDGESVASTATNNGSYVAMENDTADLMISGRFNAGSPQSGRYFKDKIGLFIIEGTELSAANIKNIYNATRGYYYK